MCEAEGFDVFLEARRYDPLVPPELVSFQIPLHRREELLDLGELWARNVSNLLAILSPLIHDPVEEEDELLGEGCGIPTSLSEKKRQKRGGGGGKRRGVRLLLSGSCVLTLFSFSLVSW